MIPLGCLGKNQNILKSMAQDVVEFFDESIPSTMDELVSLAGVGRKTASVVLVASFGVPVKMKNTARPKNADTILEVIKERENNLESLRRSI